MRIRIRIRIRIKMEIGINNNINNNTNKYTIQKRIRNVSLLRRWRIQIGIKNVQKFHYLQNVIKVNRNVTQKLEGVFE